MRPDGRTRSAVHDPADSMISQTVPFRWQTAAFAVTVTLALLPACPAPAQTQPQPEAQPQAQPELQTELWDGQRAMAVIGDLLRFTPRSMETAGHQQTIDYIKAELAKTLDKTLDKTKADPVTLQ